MTTPLATIADALIEFILSLLRDPNAAAEFEENPGGALDSAGLGDICAEDVRAVVPVIVDRPDVVARQVYEPSYAPKPAPTGPSKPAPEPPPQIRDVVKEITTVSQNFHIDNRSTIIDQSVNQNIWAGGDVTQIFDQEAIVASGDGSVAAGDDATLTNNETDISTGDINVGNEHTNVDIDGSFNDTETDVDTDVDVDIDDSLNTDNSTEIEVDESFNDEVEVEVDNSYDNSGNVSGGEVSFVETEPLVTPAYVEEFETSVEEIEPPADLLTQP